MGMLLGFVLLVPLGKSTEWRPQVGSPTPHNAPTQDAEAAEGLVTQGWTLIPPYTGEHRRSLDERGRARTRAAAHLFAAASELHPRHVRALWSLGHAEILLAEDARTRGLASLGEHVRQAEDALGRALEIDPDDPWCLYARGAFRTGFGSLDGALADLDRADAITTARVAETGTDGNDAWLRFKARQWRPEALMHERTVPHKIFPADKIKGY